MPLPCRKVAMTAADVMSELLRGWSRCHRLVCQPPASRPGPWSSTERGRGREGRVGPQRTRGFVCPPHKHSGTHAYTLMQSDRQLIFSTTCKHTLYFHSESQCKGALLFLPLSLFLTPSVGLLTEFPDSRFCGFSMRMS